MTIANICSCVSCAIALASIFASIYAVVQSRKTALTGAFFSDMANAYSDFLKCVPEFAFRRGSEERDALAAALYRLLLFASPEICDKAQNLYVYLLDWAATNPTRALSVDEAVNQLGGMMRDHLRTSCRRGKL